MQNKKYYFLAGLPRTGNTLLSSILNQNPKLKVSANSFMDDYLYRNFLFFQDEKFLNFPDETSLNNLLSNSFDSYYKDWDADYIIDRGMWGTPTNIFLIKRYIKNEIKIICTVRDVVEIIASFLRVSEKGLKLALQNDIRENKRFDFSYKTELELLCEMLMSPTGQIEKSLFSLKNLVDNESKDIFHIVEYNDLVKNTEQTIRKIYNFLNIEYFSHNYESIEQFKINNIKYNDSIYGENMKLHELKKTISIPHYNVTDILSPRLIQKYSNLEFWRN